MSNADIILSFLSFRETLFKAILHEENPISKNNLEEISKNYDVILSRLDVKRLELLGQEYDYNNAECIQTVEVLEKEKHNIVLDVLEQAYTYKNKIIKPGKVIIGLFKEE